MSTRTFSSLQNAVKALNAFGSFAIKAADELITKDGNGEYSFDPQEVQAYVDSKAVNEAPAAEEVAENKPAPMKVKPRAKAKPVVVNLLPPEDEAEEVNEELTEVLEESEQLELLDAPIVNKRATAPKAAKVAEKPTKAVEKAQKPAIHKPAPTSTSDLKYPVKAGPVRMIWDTAYAMIVDGKFPERKDVLARIVALGCQASTGAIQFQKCRKFWQSTQA